MNSARHLEYLVECMPVMVLPPYVVSFCFCTLCEHAFFVVVFCGFFRWVNQFWLCASFVLLRVYSDCTILSVVFLSLFLRHEAAVLDFLDL